MHMPMHMHMRFSSVIIAAMGLVAGGTVAAQVPVGREIRGAVYDSLSKVPLAHDRER